MYTGITQGIYEVVELEEKNNLIRFSVQLPIHLRDNLKIGASVNLDGVCHTVVAITNDVVSFESDSDKWELPLQKGRQT